MQLIHSAEPFEVVISLDLSYDMDVAGLLVASHVTRRFLNTVANEVADPGHTRHLDEKAAPSRTAAASWPTTNH